MLTFDGQKLKLANRLDVFNTTCKIKQFFKSFIRQANELQVGLIEKQNYTVGYAYSLN